MRTGCLQKVLVQLLPADGGGLTDGQLLGRFLDGREEAAFTALVRRHGPMVLGVCRRVLGNVHDAEDAFQATFLVLARKAASVLQREAVGSFLYAVAYRTALRARACAVRRRATERQVQDMPHPEVAPAEARDWQELLDEALAGLPEKYRVAVVLCDLEGRTRREAARQLRLPEGTLSSRLATARRMLAQRLARRGLALSGGALAAALAEGAAPAVPASLVRATVQAAVLVAAGKAAAVTAPAALLMNEVLKAMFLTKLKIAAAVIVTVALGAGGFVYRAAGEAAPPVAKPLNELEALRRENDLLKLNLEVVLEKVRALDTEVRTLRGRLEAKAAGPGAGTFLDLGAGTFLDLDGDGRTDLLLGVIRKQHALDPAQEVEAALKAFREARDPKAQRQALEVLDKALKKLKEHVKPADKPAPRSGS
jgi:RNA polymerase sigma factor (sigma-70 family)